MPEMTPEDTVEYWLGRHRAEGTDPNHLRDFLSTVSPDTPQAIAARQYIAELEHAHYAAEVSLAHAKDQPVREQEERHHQENLAQSRKQSRRAEVVAWCSLLVALGALVLSQFPARRNAAKTAVLTPPASAPAEEMAALPSPTAVTAVVVTPDPVKQLDSLIQTRLEPKGFKFYNVKYDVEKTNSLTAPYTAVISGTHSWSEDEKPKQIEKFVLYAEYRNGEWCYSHSDGQTTYFENGQVTTLSFDPAVDHGKSLALDLHLKVKDY